MANQCYNYLELLVTEQGLNLFKSCLNDPESGRIEFDYHKYDGVFDKLFSEHSDVEVPQGHDAKREWMAVHFGSTTDLDNGDFTVDENGDGFYLINITYETNNSPHSELVWLLEKTFDWCLGACVKYFEPGFGYFGISSSGLLSVADYTNDIENDIPYFEELFGEGTYEEWFPTEDEDGND